MQTSAPTSADAHLATMVRPSIARLALALTDLSLGGKRLTRASWRKAPMPHGDQATAFCLKLIDLGIDVDDEHDLSLALALLKSRLTLDDIALYAEAA